MKFLVVLILFAVATYFLVRLVQERGLPGSKGPGGGGRGNLPGRPQGPRGPRTPRPSAPPAPRGPDDDDDFLRELDRKRRTERDDSEG